MQACTSSHGERCATEPLIARRSAGSNRVPVCNLTAETGGVQAERMACRRATGVSARGRAGSSAAVGDDFLGEAGHRVEDERMVHDPALVEIADELVHAVFAPQRLDSVDAIGGIAKD